MKKIIIGLMLTIGAGKVFAAEEINCYPMGDSRYSQITLSFAEKAFEQNKITTYEGGGSEESLLLKIKNKRPGYVEFEVVGEDEGQMVLGGSILSIFSEAISEQYRCYE